MTLPPPSQTGLDARGCCHLRISKAPSCRQLHFLLPKSCLGPLVTSRIPSLRTLVDFRYGRNLSYEDFDLQVDEPAAMT